MRSGLKRSCQSATSGPKVSFGEYWTINGPPIGQILVARPYPERNIASTTVCSSTKRINGINMTGPPMSLK
jgi:hypothetical protein